MPPTIRALSKCTEVAYRISFDPADSLSRQLIIRVCFAGLRVRGTPRPGLREPVLTFEDEHITGVIAIRKKILATKHHLKS